MTLARFRNWIPAIGWLSLSLTLAATDARPLAPRADPVGGRTLTGPTIGEAAGQRLSEIATEVTGRHWGPRPGMVAMEAGYRATTRLRDALWLPDGHKPIVTLVNNEPLTGADEQIAWSSATNQVIQFYQSQVAKAPKDPTNYRSLGAAYMQKARESGDVTYYGLSEKALKQALALQPSDRLATGVITRLALVALSRHEYPDALAYAGRALGYGTGQLFPYAVLGDTYFDIGEYDKAAETYGKLTHLAGAAYPSTRLGALHALRGNMQEAMDETERGIEALLKDNAPRENVAWAEFRLGELAFSRGDLVQSEAAYRNAMQSYAGYHWALGGLARVRAAQKRYEDAIKLYQQAIGVIPLPQYAAALGDVYTKLDRRREANKQYALVEYIGYLNVINKEMYNRDLALFYADHNVKLPQALELAERELKVRRDVYTYDVLAWALYKNQKPEAALRAMSEALKFGTKEARFFFHAGMIYRAVGDPDKARELLQLSLATNPHFHVLHAEVAEKTLRALGQPGSP
jgi:tetratricopeptide (TPR) repeat protein